MKFFNIFLYLGMNKIKLLMITSVWLISFNISSQDVVEKNYNTFEEFLTEQNLKILKINNGLNKIEVEQIMGNSMIVNIPKVGKMRPLKKLFKQPEYINEYNHNPEKKINIYWYFSTPKDQDGIISKKECTPVIFENDSVVGNGWPFFNNYRRTVRLN